MRVPGENCLDLIDHGCVNGRSRERKTFFLSSFFGSHSEKKENPIRIPREGNEFSSYFSCNEEKQSKGRKCRKMRGSRQITPYRTEEPKREQIYSSAIAKHRKEGRKNCGNFPLEWNFFFFVINVRRMNEARLIFDP